jgi:hypothetical protein
MLNFFGSSGQLAARQKHDAFASQAFQANIGAHPDDLPTISPAGMRFAQRHQVVQA